MLRTGFDPFTYRSMTDISLADQLARLKQAKLIVQKQPSHYPPILSSILPIAQRSEPELRLWCAEFLVDAFSSEDIDVETKKPLAAQCLDTVLSLLNDASYSLIVQNTATCAATLYGLVFAYICANPSEGVVWNKLLKIKTKVLGLLESSHFGIQAASIKFAQQVVLVQSVGTNDPRLATSNDVSLSMVPMGHPLIDNTLEAEGLGLLDRLLSVFSERRVYAPKLTCTINALYPVIKTRPAMAPKILTYILNFDSSQKVTSGNSDDNRSELEYRFIDKSLRLMLGNIQKHNLVPKLSSRISSYLSTVSQGRASEKLKRRITQQGDDSPSKRVRLERSTMPVNSSTALGSGPCSYSQLFNLINPEDPLGSFDAKELSIELAVNIALAGIAAANIELLNNSIDIIKKRYNNLKEQASLQPQFNQYYPMDGYDNEEEDDYTGMAAADDDNMQTAGEGEDDGQGPNSPPVDSDDDDDQGALLPASSFSLPPPLPLSVEERTKQIGGVVDRLISYSTFTESTNSSLSASLGANVGRSINRIAVTEWTKDTWVILASRILTRGICRSIVDENIIREHLFNYVMGNFKDRLDLIVLWLTEEWFGEYKRNGNDAYSPDKDSNYYKWAEKLLDQIIPLLEPNDKKGFLRLLSDLPVLTQDLIYKIKSLCIDPYRSQMGFLALRFLIMLKPPVKEYCLNLLTDLYREDPSSGAKAILKQYRPQVLEEVKPEPKGEVKVEVKEDVKETKTEA